jgi:hypothetical protein
LCALCLALQGRGQGLQMQLHFVLTASYKARPYGVGSASIHIDVSDNPGPTGL